MSRRTAAGLLAMALIAAFVIGAAFIPTGYVYFKPGPTIDVLAKNDGKETVQVTGHRAYYDDGELRMVTVLQSSPQTELSLSEVIWDWFDPNVALLPRDVVFKKGTTNEQQRQESAVEMATSQDDATAAALSALGITYTSRLAVAEVDAGGPANKKLESGDILISVNGVPTTDVDALIARIKEIRPGTSIPVVVERAGKRTTVRLTTAARPDAKSESRIGIVPGIKPQFPFEVKINIPDSVGGPSAGMMFALSIYDVLTPGSLTNGKVIAGSGTIDAKGVVGSIGGIGQKIAGAQRDGAKLFLVAEENCAEAAASHYDHDKIRLVKVHTLAEAIKDVEAWGKNPNASLPGCAK